MGNYITLHPKYGVNPTLPTCIVCGKDTGEIALLGNAYKGEAPMHMVVGVEPCAECREKYLKEGVMLVEANMEIRRSGKPDYKPTGNLMIIKESAFRRIFNVDVPQRHIAFVEVGVLSKITAMTMAQE
jgi:mRNA-degrading endonuclease RelE of RelBE toxin-antitoxin system